MSEPCGQNSSNIQYSRCLLGKTLQHEHVVITDYDGPRDAHGEPACEEVTLELLREKLHDETRPFGHGYVVAAELLEIPSAAFLVPP